MSKKTWILISCLVLSLTLGLGGSLAYLTDTDTKVNTFTMGDVDITLEENFQQGSAFVPSKPIEKEAWIENTGSNDAWVWMTVALPRVLEGESVDAANDNYVHINTPGAFWYGYQNTEKYWSSATEAGIPIQSGEPSFPVAAEHTWKVGPDCAPGQIVIIDGIEYYVETRLYNGIVKPGEKTNYGISGVYLDAHVDYDPVENKYYYINNGAKTEIDFDLSDVKIIVSAFAIQAEGFKNVEEAYAAYMGQWTAEGKLTADMIDGVTSAAPESGATRPAGYIPNNEGEIIDGLVIADASDENTNLRALYNGEGASNYLTGDLTVKNSKLDGTYAMNLYAVEANEVDMMVENTVLSGWVSYTGFDSVTFTGCTFTINSENTQKFIQPYDTTTFVNCAFKGSEMGLLYLTAADTVTFENCTWNGQKIDANFDISKLIVEPNEAVTITIK